MIMKRILFFGSLLTLGTLAHAQTDVIQGVMRGKDFGVTYMLPQSVLNIEATVTKTQYIPGEFAKYANRYLRLDNVSSTPSEYYELTKVDVVPIGIPNSEQTYFIKMKDKTVAPLVELTQEGIIKTINMPRSAVSNNTSSTPVIINNTRTINPRDFLTEEILMANSTAKMAELVAREIYSIRESKNALIRGQADFMPQDGNQMKMMIDELNAQEASLMSMFIGTNINEAQVYSIKVMPRDIEKEVVFRFSKKLGLVPNNDLGGEPIYISIKDLKSVALPEDNGKKKVDGIAYNVPGKALVVLNKGNQTIFKSEIPLSQFGSTEYPAPALFNKNSTIKVEFNPATGGLIKIEREDHK